MKNILGCILWDWIGANSQPLTVCLIILGWFLVYWFNRRIQDRQIKNNACREVYKELYYTCKNAKHSLGLLEIHLISPIFSIMNLLKLNAETSSGNSSGEIRNIEEAKKKNTQSWNEYLNKLDSQITELSTVFTSLGTSIDMWMHLMPNIREPRNNLTKQSAKVFEEIFKTSETLHLLEWEALEINAVMKIESDLKQLSKRISILQDEVNKIQVLIHNNLITPIFGYKMQNRSEYEK